ncbi:aldehyde dehydrogenase family protein [Plastoroseomonas hellenica]|uniref:aldehyde dehydrogenase family protein n=1 Tax=Plastoroseomonas hellenica TaxID=2687306 RepID=UPI001BA726B5|nr:aldehyde dehydrogenase family protein [Plastoroseomonas hellenica]MBR0642724.1 aldehyde dehydrogenase family protein [Plastoroseomonas hellenica]
MTTTDSPSPYEGFDRQFIGGEWRVGSSSHVIEDINPYDGSIITRVQGASANDVEDAYQAALKAQPEWAATPPRERASIMARAAAITLARREEIVAASIQEAGCVRTVAEFLWQLAWSILDASASYPSRVTGQIVPTESITEESLIYRKPVGVIAVISPWNAPINLTMRSLAPALALGNAVVLKPAGDTPVTGGLFHARIFEEAGLPKGVLSVVIGASDEIGDPVVENDAAALVSFTGSTDVGRSLFAKVGGSKRIKRLGLELGGNAPFVVLDDADLDAAAHALVVSRFMHQGQICMSANRAIVDETVFDAFVERVTERARALAPGDPMDAATVIGPIINRHQVEGIIAKINQAKADGARAVLEGPVSGTQGNIIPPHIFVDVEPSYAIAREESFGPLLPMLKARDEAHALALANDTEFGLSASVFTGDLDRGKQFMLKVESGMGHVNGICVADSEYAAYGGEKNSGLGRFNAEWVIGEFTRPHWITVQRGEDRLPF